MEHRDVIWFEDTSAALASVARGKSKCESMDVAAEDRAFIQAHGWKKPGLV